ncbi:MAG: hypothetical protein ACRDJM_05050 [Actinomycetota bacterium]
MHRAILAAAVAGASLLGAGGAGAETVHAGTCGIEGTITLSSPITAAPQQVDFTLAGAIQCYDIVNTATPGLRGAPIAGDLTGQGAGNVACEGGASGGSFEAAFSTGVDTRDLWVGTFGSAGGPLSLLSVTVRAVEQQHFDSIAGEWVTDSSDTTGANLTGGAFMFTVEDPAVCDPNGAGTSSAGFSGRLAHVFETAPAGV